MSLNDRQNKIIDELKLRGQLEVEQLATKFAVSSQTIRKDINQLCELGLARRLHGGVDLPPNTRNISFHSRQLINEPAKQQIARQAAEQIPDGASVFLGIGTTVAHVARALLEHKSLKVMTNNLDVAAVFCEQPEIDVLVAGGQLRHSDRDLVGEAAIRFFNQFHVDFGIIGSGGLDQEAGLLDFDPKEAEVSRAILANARKTILLADQSKWRRRAMVKVEPFNAIDLMITDSIPDASAREILARSDVQTIEVFRT